MARTLKDLICRYKTLKGFRVERKAGWDTHGLPVEIEVEKELGIQNKSEIPNYGVAKYNAACKASVFKYLNLWEQMTTRMGYWIDLDSAYITFKNEYIESVWWSLSELFKKGLLYKGFKIVPQCPHCETPLSSHELSLGYEEVRDPNVYAKFKLKDEDASILVWTTTPWTLISNVALAVGSEIDYVKIKVEGHGVLYLAKARLSVIKEEYTIIEELKGQKLLDKEYEPLFDYIAVDKKAWYVIPGEFVSTEDGSGVVHIAPAFGADDYEVSKKFNLPFIQPVTIGGRFTDEVKDFAGRLVKTIKFKTHEEKGADPDILKNLKERKLIYSSSNDYLHSYPHCWRCKQPVIFRATPQWFISMDKTGLRKKALEEIDNVKWVPHWGRERIYGMIENRPDWCVSRQRAWGVPIAVFLCDKCETLHINQGDQLATIFFHCFRHILTLCQWSK